MFCWLYLNISEADWTSFDICLYKDQSCFLSNPVVCWCCATFVASLGAEKPEKTRDFFIPQLKPSSSEFRTTSSTHACDQANESWADLPQGNCHLLHPTCPGKIPKNVCGAIASILHFLQVKHGETFISVAQIPPSLLHKPLNFLLKSHPVFLLHPIFVQIFGWTAQKKKPDTQRVFPPLPVWPCEYWPQEALWTAERRISAERRNAGSGVLLYGIISSW